MGVVAFGCIDFCSTIIPDVFFPAHCGIFGLRLKTEADAVTLGALVNCCDKAGVASIASQGWS